MDMDSTTAKAAGWEWANGKPPALYGVIAAAMLCLLA